MSFDTVTATISHIRFLRSAIIFQIENPHSPYDKLICYLPYSNYVGEDSEWGCRKLQDLKRICAGLKTSFIISNKKDYMVKNANGVPKKRFHILDSYCVMCPPNREFTLV